MSISERADQQRSQTEGNRALELFVDRHELTKRFAEYLNDDPPPEKILIFHGDGGNGKSLLLKFLLNHCCKRLPAEVWQEYKVKPSAEVVDFLQRVTDWECNFKFVPIVLLDFDGQPVGDDRPQDPFYGLLMLQRRLVKAANQQGYKLHFPLFEFACAWYLKQKGKLTTEHINKFLISEELFILGGISNIIKNAGSSLNPFVPLLLTLAAQAINFLKKHQGGDLTVGYLRGRGLKEEDFQKIMQLSERDLIEALPDFFAEDLVASMQRAGAPERVILFFDTHEAFWGDWRKRGEALFFEQDKWLRRLLAKLDLSAGIVVGVAGREVPRWTEASNWRIPRECLDTQLVWHLKEKDARHYLQQSGIEEAELCESLVRYARLESEQVHPLFLGLCADVVLTARERGETLRAEDFQSIPQLDHKCQVLIERLLKYVDEDVRDAVDALSASRAFNRELFFTLGQALHFQATDASFRCLTHFSFIWQAQEKGEDWYRIHPLVRRLNLKNHREMTRLAHPILEQYYRERGDVAEAIYHVVCQNWRQGIQQWLEVFNTAKQERNLELCRTLDRNPQGTEFLVAQVAQSVGDYYALLKQYEVAKEEYQEAIALYSQVPANSSDFRAAQTNQAIVGQALEQFVATVKVNPVSPGRVLVNLSRWLDNLTEAAEAGWQAVEAILEPRKVELAYGYARGATTKKLPVANSVERAKILDFELPLDKRSVVLIVSLQPEDNQEIDVLVQVFPQDEQPYLSLGLILKVTLDSGSPDAESEEVTAMGKEEGIQLEFSESPGNLVKVEVAWGDAVKVEEFVV